MRALPALVFVAGPVAAEGAAVFETPSGLELTLQDVVWEPESGVVRLRFVAEALGGAEPVAVAGDLPWLWETYGVPALERNRLEAAQLVISIADRAIPLDPDAVQLFEGYSVDAAGASVWEPY